MSTATNGIATRGEANNIIIYDFSGDLTKCPTWTELINKQYTSINGQYAANQLVKYSDISLNVPAWKSTVYVGWTPV